ncbi:ABC transporter substrate-binding protein [Herbaspirillum sp. GCM10030257]|uniref:ABC transporter substrate-binding protein n=1 Tax=Herbaspirillum sp. GCM10030257 TaxID=3273393 RepID=UPI00361D907C
MKRLLALLSPLALAASLLLPNAAAASDVELLPSDLLTPTTKEQTPANQYKKNAPWRVGVSFAGMGNTWIVQMIQEMRFEAARNKNIAEFILVEANWKPAKQVADVEDLLAKKIDVLIMVPISQAVGMPLIKKAAQQGIPVVTLGAYGSATMSTTEISAGGEVFGKQGGEYLRKVLNGKGNIWAFRGIAGVDEEQLRYDGFRKAIAGSNLKITNEVFGDWSYAKGKQLCENLVLSGQPVDGIWFSGADMTRACMDVFKETGKPLVPMTGEANNGFLRAWKQANANSVAPVFTPSLGAAFVRAATSLLEGKQLYRSYFSTPEPITRDKLDKYIRNDLNEAYWMPSSLPEPKLKELFHQ